VKVIRASKDKVVMALSKREKSLLLKILELYPRVPSSYQQLSRTSVSKDLEDHQQLLDEALLEQRTENKQRLARFLGNPLTFEQNSQGCCLHLCQTDMEWLLQILNDVRVGSWIALGSPEEKLPALNPETAPDFWAMEIAGFLEVSLLNAWGIEPYSGV